jgi:hypothetical protein
MIVHESSRNEERAAGMCIRQRFDQIVKALRLRASVERQRDFVLAAWTAIDLAKSSQFCRLRATILLAHFRF